VTERVWSTGVIILTAVAEVPGGKPVPVPLCPQHISQALAMFELGPLRWETGDRCPEPWHGLRETWTSSKHHVAIQFVLAENTILSMTKASQLMLYRAAISSESRTYTVGECKRGHDWCCSMRYVYLPPWFKRGMQPYS